MSRIKPQKLIELSSDIDRRKKYCDIEPDLIPYNQALVILCITDSDCSTVIGCLQSHVHGDAWRAEAEQPHTDEHDAGRIQGRPEDAGRIPVAHQIGESQNVIWR